MSPTRLGIGIYVPDASGHVVLGGVRYRELTGTIADNREDLEGLATLAAMLVEPNETKTGQPARQRQLAGQPQGD